MATVFLSYRREDSRADTGRLYDHLGRQFGEERVFMDVDDIAPGDNFVEKLDATLQQCDVMIPVIGPQWTQLTDANGQPRLGNPRDFLTMEIAKALERDIVVIPVLVGGASMPRQAELPASLASLAQHQALSIRYDRFHDDVAHLVRSIQRQTGASTWRARLRPVRGRLAVAVVAVVAVMAIGWWLTSGVHSELLRANPSVLSGAKVRAMLTENDFFTSVSNTAAKGGRHDYRARVIREDIVIVDRVTGLMWQKGASPMQMEWARAVSAVERINRNGYAGFHDWRLPTLEEAASLIATNAVNGYFLSPVFEARAAPAMWTSDTNPEGRRWVVWYSDATLVPESPGFNAWVRLVRSTRE